MENRSSCVRLIGKLDTTLLDSLLHFFAHDCRPDKPRSNDIHSHAHTRHRSTHASHDASHAPFACTVLRRTRLVQITRQTGRHDEASITTFWIAVEVVYCEFGGVPKTNGQKVSKCLRHERVWAKERLCPQMRLHVAATWFESPFCPSVYVHYSY